MNFLSVYDQFWDSAESCTLLDLTDEEANLQSYNLLIKAIAAFRFPQVSLAYAAISGTEPVEYQFTGEVTQREINVILEYMRVYWLTFQVSKESRYENLYYDSSAKTYSPANMVKELKDLLTQSIAMANRANVDYNRMVSGSGVPMIGIVNS